MPLYLVESKMIILSLLRLQLNSVKGLILLDLFSDSHHNVRNESAKFGHCIRDAKFPSAMDMRQGTHQTTAG